MNRAHEVAIKAIKEWLGDYRLFAVSQDPASYKELADAIAAQIRSYMTETVEDLEEIGVQLTFDEPNPPESDMWIGINQAKKLIKELTARIGETNEQTRLD